MYVRQWFTWNCFPNFRANISFLFNPWPNSQKEYRTYLLTPRFARALKIRWNEEQTLLRYESYSSSYSWQYDLYNVNKSEHCGAAAVDRIFSLHPLSVLASDTDCPGLSHLRKQYWFRSRWIDIDRAGIFKQSMGARIRVGIGLSYRPARLHRLAEFIPWNRFLGSINV